VGDRKVNKKEQNPTARSQGVNTMPPKKWRTAIMEPSPSVVELHVLDMWQIFSKNDDKDIIEVDSNFMWYDQWSFL